MAERNALLLVEREWSNLRSEYDRKYGRATTYAHKRGIQAMDQRKSDRKTATA